MKKNFKIKKNFLESFEYLKKSKNFIWGIVVLFFVFAFIGFFVPAPLEIQERIMEIIRQLLRQTEGLSALELIWFIFWNNLKSSFFGFILGFFFGIFPILVALGNGYLLGFVASKAVQVDGFLSLWRIFPHGIFELPAVFISLGIGLKLGSFIFQKQKINFLKDTFWNSLNLFILVVIPLLIIAAIIEGLLIYLVK